MAALLTSSCVLAFKARSIALTVIFSSMLIIFLYYTTQGGTSAVLPVKFFICSSRLLFLFSVPRQLLPTRFVQAPPLQSQFRNRYQRNYLSPLARCRLALPSEFRLLLLSSNVFSRSSCYNIPHKSLIVKGELTHKNL